MPTDRLTTARRSPAGRKRTRRAAAAGGHATAASQAPRPPRAAPVRRTTALAELDGRERILAVAIRSFSEAGYEGTTTAGVARDAGVTQPLVHHHFGSKEALWRAAMDVLFADVHRVAEVPVELPLPDRFLAVVDRLVRFVAAHPEVTRVIAREGAAPSPRLDYLVERYLRAPFLQTVEAMRAAQRAGLVAPEIRADLLLFLVLGAGSHLFDVTALARETLGIDAGAARTCEDVVTLMRTLLVRGVFPATPARRRRRAAT